LCYLKNKRPTCCHLVFNFTSYVLNMFRTLIYPSPRACDYSVELPHWSYCSWFDVCWSFGVWVGVVPVLQAEAQMVCSCASACNTDTTPTQPHRNSNTHRTKNNTTNTVIQQNNRKLLMMAILMSEICWAHKKWNKIASDTKLVIFPSTNISQYLWFHNFRHFQPFFFFLHKIFNTVKCTCAIILHTNTCCRRSRWPRGLRRRSTAARLLRLWVRIPQKHGCLSVVNVACCR